MTATTRGLARPNDGTAWRPTHEWTPANIFGAGNRLQMFRIHTGPHAARVIKL